MDRKKKIGLVVEGGGMKCAYNAGILDAFLDHGISLLGQGPVFWPGVFRVPKNGGLENQKTTCYASG